MTSPNKKNFADLYLKGKAFADDIDDFVDVWHKGGTGMPLHEFLGLSRDQYARWVQNPDSLQSALAAAKHNGSRRVSHRKSSAVARGTKNPVTTATMPTVAQKRTARLAAVGDLLKVVCDPARLPILLILSEGERDAEALGQCLRQSQATVSRHLALLRHRGLITPRREGNIHVFALTKAGEKVAKTVSRLAE